MIARLTGGLCHQYTRRDEIWGGWCLVLLHWLHALMTRHSDNDKPIYFVKWLHIVRRSITPHDMINQHASTLGCFASILAGCLRVNGGKARHVLAHDPQRVLVGRAG